MLPAPARPSAKVKLTVPADWIVFDGRKTSYKRCPRCFFYTHVLGIGIVRRYTADDAIRMGLANRLIAPKELESTVIEYARALADSEPLSVLANKETMRHLVQDPPNLDLACTAELNALFKSSWDFGWP